MSFSSISGGRVRAASDIELGMLGFNEGLDTARQCLGEMENAGGFNVYFQGNSFLDGYEVSNFFNDHTCYLTIAELQRLLQPKGYAPDLGHVPIRTGNIAGDGVWGNLNTVNSANNMVFSFSGTAANLSNTGGGDSICRKYTSITGTSTQRLGWLLDPTVSTPIPRAATRVDAIFGPGAAGIETDLTEGGTTFVTAASAAIGPTIDSSAYVAGTRVNLSAALDPTSQYWIQIAAPATGVAACDGIWVANSNKGISGGLCTRVGGNIYGDNWNEATLVATIDSPTSRPGTGMGGTNDRVRVFAYGLNEYAAQNSLANFSTAFQTQLTRYLARGGSAILEVQMVLNPAFYSAPLTIPYQSYVDVIYALASANGCALWDPELMFGGRSAANTTLYNTLGFKSTNTHLTNVLALWQAQMRAAVIYRGLTG